MDGYAVRAADVEVARPLPVVGVIAAGRPAERPLQPGQAMRIMTGAPLPAGADTVIMQEDADEKDGLVRFHSQPVAGQHVRRAGEDLSPGSEVLRPGDELMAGELGLLAAIGRTLVPVHRRPRVAIVSTGDELVPADQPPGPGQIVGSNAHALAAQVVEAGGEPHILPFARDERASLKETFTHALTADVVLSSGGVSVGEFDYVKEVLAELHVVERFWQVAMKPGKPLSFGVGGVGGVGGGRLVFGLPGNPASSMVSFELFVRPALRRLLGFSGAALTRPVALARLAAEVMPDRRRIHFMRARLVRAGGALTARPLLHQGSGMLRSLIGVNALLEIPAGPAPLPAGSEVAAHLLALV
jgi:molybdopterin molybdotransferase